MSHLADTTRESQPLDSWELYVPLEFWKHKLSDRERVVFQLLDTFARNDTFCFVGYVALGKLANKSARSLQLIVGSLEEKGFVRVVFEQGKNSHRVGIILLKRVNPDVNPAADTPEAVAAAEDFLRKRRPGEAGANSCAQKPATDLSHRNGRSQRIQLEKLSPKVRGLFSALTASDDPDIVLSEMRRLVVDIARMLPTAPKGDVQQMIDDYAALSLTVTLDHDGDKDGNLASHYDMALWLRKREVSSVALVEGLYNAVEQTEQGKARSTAGMLRAFLDSNRVPSGATN
jgi:hypothetical protein